MSQIIEAVQQCQDRLYFKSYVDEFSRRLIKTLPMSDEDMQRYEGVFKGLPDSVPERLLILSKNQDCPDLMQLALLSLVRQAELALDSTQAREWYEKVVEFAAGDTEYVFEALISLGHWRTRVAPFFIEQFKNQIPSYMLRHKIKSGMTGWAQIHGLRGNTSLEKRIEYDIYYIEKWSFWLDIKILFLTIPALFKGV